VQLPNGERAVVDVVKLRDYVLSPYHPRGRHKARVFASALRIFQSDAEFLRNSLLQAASTGDAVEGNNDSWGRRYIVDFECVRAERTAMVRSIWIVPTGEDFPRLTTCFVI
jgi:hypothetical protein